MPSTPIFFLQTSEQGDVLNQFLNTFVLEYKKWYERKSLKGKGAENAKNQFAKQILEFSKSARSKLPKGQNDTVRLKSIKDSLKVKSDGRIWFTPKMLCVYFDYVLAYSFEGTLRAKFQSQLLSEDHYPEIGLEQINDLKHFFELIVVNADKLGENVEEERLQFNAHITSLCDAFGIEEKVRDELLFNEEWKSSLIRKHVYPIRNKNQKEQGDSGSSISDFYSRLKRDFSTIELKAPRFSLPINQMIHLSLCKEDRSKEALKIKLENELKLLQHEGSENNKLIQELRAKIYHLNIELNKLHDVIPLLESGSSIFIKGPGGSGKSTLLRWVVYACATKVFQKDKPILPIYIELRLYESTSSIEELVFQFLDMYSLNEKVLKENHIILLVDGYDEFVGIQSLLLSEILSFKTKFSSQVVFSGRKIPNLDTSFTIYYLKEFSISDIRSLCLYQIGEENGVKLINLIEEKNLEKDLNRPLFLVFVLIYIQEYKDGFLWRDIERYIINQGELLENIIVDQYLKTYEKGDLNESVDWYETKNKEIEIISQIAYHLTISEAESLSFSLEDALNLSYKVKFHINKKSFISSTLKGFIDHGLLVYHKKGLFSFTKKEIKHFFVARYLSKNISSFKEYKKSQRQILGGEWDWYTAFHSNNSWAYIEVYLFGIIDPNLVINKKAERTIKGRHVIINSFLENLDACLKLIDRGRVVNDSVFNSREAIFTMINDFSLLPKGNKKWHVYYYITSSIWRGLLSISTYFGFLLSGSYIDKMNRMSLAYGGSNFPRSQNILFMDLFMRFEISYDYGQLAKLIGRLQNNFVGAGNGSNIPYVFNDREHLLIIAPDQQDKLFFDYFFGRKEGFLQGGGVTPLKVVEYLFDIHKYSFYNRLFRDYKNYEKYELLKAFKVSLNFIEIWLMYDKMDDSMKSDFRCFFANFACENDDYFNRDEFSIFVSFLNMDCDEKSREFIVSDLSNNLQRITNLNQLDDKQKKEKELLSWKISEIQK